MSTLPLITFDASIKGNSVGIGIYDKNNNDSFSFKIKINISNSLHAERIALIQTLKYLQARNIKKAHLFTDNSYLAREGISKILIDKYIGDNSYITLSWLPRELNQIADKFSKKAHKVKPIIKTETGIITNIRQNLPSYSNKQKFGFVKRFALTEDEYGFVVKLENNEKVTSFNGFSKYVKMIKTVFPEGELENFDEIRHNIKGSLSHNKMIRFINGRQKNIK